MPVKFTVSKATPVAGIPREDVEAVYDPAATLADYALNGGWRWSEGSETPVGNAGERIHTALFTPEDTVNYSSVESDITFRISKAVPDPAYPKDAEAAEGDTLGSIALPDGWTWDAGNSAGVGAAGIRQHNATFTPGDTDNYESLSHTVNITVASKAPSEADEDNKPPAGDEGKGEDKGTPTPIAAIPGASSAIAPGSSYTLPADIEFSDGTKANVTWESADPSVATVGQNGKVRITGEGEATLTARTADGKAQSVTITAAKNVSEIRTPLKAINMVNGTSLSLPACADSIRPVTGRAQNKAMLTWKSSNAKVATVNENGKVKALKTGTVRITCTSLNGEKLEVKVNVVAKAVKMNGFSVAHAPKSMKVGQTSLLKIRLKNQKATNLRVRFVSTDQSILKLDRGGKLTALKKGKVRITVKVGNMKYTKTVTVK
jgi:alpha-L-fucosidase 2